jgi:hypothetical protein
MGFWQVFEGLFLKVFLMVFCRFLEGFIKIILKVFVGFYRFLAIFRGFVMKKTKTSSYFLESNSQVVKSSGI